jgi:hypothetical protein
LESPASGKGRKEVGTLLFSRSCGKKLSGEIKAKAAKKNEMRSKVGNQSAILGLGQELMTESTISHPDPALKFVYSDENVAEHCRN